MKFGRIVGKIVTFAETIIYIMKLFFAAVVCMSVLSLYCPADAAGGVKEPPASRHDRTGLRGEFRQALFLYGKGMYEEAMSRFSRLASEYDDPEARGYAVLCAVRMKLPSYGELSRRYLEKYPFTLAASRIKYADALNLFDAGDYAAASAVLESLDPKSLERGQRDEFLFKRAYCDYETGNTGRALERFAELAAGVKPDYAAASSYMAGYICYCGKDFTEAAGWFGQSSGDSRFSAMSRYYIAECRFMLKDYEYVTDNGPGLLESVPEDCLPKLNRIISESYLVLGNAPEARKYYDRNPDKSQGGSRSDFFYAGSLLYAVGDFAGAIDNFSMMADRCDSIGQAANYKLGYSYIRTKNKVSALNAFKAASEAVFDPAISEDAYFNYAKLSFDLNNDRSVFRRYLEKYPDAGKSEKIYSYMAVAALQEHDYAGAVEAYDNIDELDPVMKSNYMKANYLRATELAASGAWRDAVPYLKAAVYYSDRRTVFNQMSNYWLAEAYYRGDRFDDALAIYTRLYNISALYGMAEAWLIPYGTAYCHFKKENYSSAAEWFGKYLQGDRLTWRKDAMLRYADCLFMQKKYAEAASSYDEVRKEYHDVNDIYPYYQAAVAYGLSGNEDRKISLLANVMDADAASPFYPEALFELGRSYLVGGEDDLAAETYGKLVSSSRDSTFIAKALIELGMISRNRSDNAAALRHYKRVVEEFPVSGYADDALLAIESVYQSENNPQAYLDYIAEIGRSSLKTEDERELMIFNAAEQIYLSENYPKAIVSLQSYVSAYPHGSKIPQAYYYLAECYRNTGKPDSACDYYAKVLDTESGSYHELACLNYAGLSYSMQRYEQAFAAYGTLSEIASLDNNRYQAKLGMMRSSYRAKMFGEAVGCAEDVLADSRADADERREAEFIKAKSCLAGSRREEAYAIFSSLASDPDTPEGAESAYLLILDSYDRGDFAQVETRVYSFSDLSGGQAYWLAKAFLVLGDSFVDRGDYSQAMATFESIRDGYSAPEGGDDIADNVSLRIRKLEEIMQREAAEK